MDKWFALSVSHARPEDAAARAAALAGHPAFNIRNPNRFRATFGALAGHPAGFHHASGAGYDTLADWLIRLDPLNPQTTARMCAAYETWTRYDAPRQARARAALERILATPGLSRDTTEMVSRILEA
jgi:aminopeptidase N